MSEAAPKLFGKYQLTDVLGQGAMGIVYRALDPLLNRYVALKLMAQGIASEAVLRDRFLREARAAGSLQHPNIITIFDFGEAEGQLYLAMEYVEGADLSDIIERRDPLPLQGKVDILIDVLRAIDYAHARGVVHRDIKPANIRVGVDGRARLMDFGIARLESSDLTKSGMIIGTPNYMSPEQVAGGAITFASDIFSLGVVAYELLTYSRAFVGDSLTAVLYQIVAAEPPVFDQEAERVPDELQAVILKSLEKDPTARYESASAMAQALSDIRAAWSAGAPVTIHARRTPLSMARSPESAAARPTPSSAPTRITAPPASVRKLAPSARGAPNHIRVAAVSAAVTLLILSGAFGAWRLFGGGNRASGGSDSSAVPALAAAGSTAESVPAAPNAPPDHAARASAPAPARPAELRSQAGPATAPASAPATPDQPRPESSQARGEAPPPVTEAVPSPAAPAAAPGANAPTPTAPTPAPTTAPTPTPPDHRRALEQLIAAYARAIESRNVETIRRAYPGLTGVQADGWRQFFGSVSAIRTRLAITDLDIEGTRAVINVAGSHAYSTSGRDQRQDVSFRATAVLEGGAWTLTQIR